MGLAIGRLGHVGSIDIPTWSVYIGVLIGAELGLVLLMLASVTVRLILRRVES
jgi:hypothetical protein